MRNVPANATDAVLANGLRAAKSVKGYFVRLRLDRIVILVHADIRHAMEAVELFCGRTFHELYHDGVSEASNAPVPGAVAGEDQEPLDVIFISRPALLSVSSPVVLS